MRNSKFIGVFSRSSNIGKKAGKELYFVWENEDKSYIIQKLNEAFIPVTAAEKISSKVLQSAFNYEPGLLAAPVSVPDLSHLALEQQKKQVAKSAELTDAALFELEQARKAKQIETDMRNNFQRALKALNRPKDRKGALAALEQIANAKEGIVPVHKHMFRDFGVSLRKKSLSELALQCASRVLELSPNDDHAHFNLARILYMLGLYDQAQTHIEKAMEIDNSEDIYKKFLNYITKQEYF